MSQPGTVNHRIILHSRPRGKPGPENFRLEAQDIPVAADGEVLTQTLYLSLDPYMRGRMSDAPSYAASVNVGAVMVGGTVSRVIASGLPAFRPGDLVLGASGWQEYDVTDGKSLTLIDPGLNHPALALGVLGMPGFTAYMGLLDIGQPKPGETVVVAAASGAVGSVVGQIAKLKGCRAVGVAGGPEKCRYVVEELGFDACIDHHDSRLPDLLAQACPKGIDVYFENVGGAVFDAVMPLLNPKSRIPVCGVISAYNSTALPPGPDRIGLLMGMILRRRIRMQGFIITQDYGPEFGTFFNQMSGWIKDGKIRYRQDIVTGLANAPAAFIGMLEGRNFGKLIVQVAEA